MAEPALSTASATITLAAQAVAVPVLALFGIPLGLRADVLLAGFAGAVAAMALLNSVPGSGDTLHELLRTSLKRVGVALASSAMAGYAAPLVALMIAMPDAVVLGVGFVIGAGAQRILPALIERVAERQAPPSVPPRTGEGPP